MSGVGYRPATASDKFQPMDETGSIGFDPRTGRVSLTGVDPVLRTVKKISLKRLALFSLLGYFFGLSSTYLGFKFINTRYTILTTTALGTLMACVFKVKKKEPQRFLVPVYGRYTFRDKIHAWVCNKGYFWDIFTVS